MIKIWIVDDENEEVLEELGNCLTDFPDRALQMYEDDLEKWENRGYLASLCWKWIN